MSLQPSRIVLTGDLLRTQAGERGQLANVRWLERWFAPVVEDVCGLIPEIRMGGAPPFSTPHPLSDLYAALGEPLGIDGWARTFARTPPAAFVDGLMADYKGALVIGVELSPLLCSALDRMGTPWIDVNVSPLRFLPDFAVSFRMSRHFSGAFPAEARLQATEIDDAVRHVRARYANGVAPGELDGALVFFAQTPQDRTLIHNGRFLGADDAMRALDEVLGARRLLVKPHPWAPDNPVVQACLDQFGGKRTDVNTYAMLAAQTDTVFATLSSSVGPEARAFGRAVHVFGEGVQAWIGSGSTTMRAARSRSLWATLLSAVLPADRPASRAESPFQPNAMRGEIGAFALDLDCWSGRA